MSIITLTLLCSFTFLELQPEPRSAFIQGRRFFTLDAALPIVVEDNATSHDLEPLEPLYDALGFRLPVAPASRFRIGSRAVYAGIVSRNPAFEHRSLRRYVPDPTKLGPGGYHLYIWRDGIVVAGVDRQGMIHGIQTLAEIIRASRRAGLNRRGVPAVPLVEIRDAPDLELRAAHVRGMLTETQIQAFASLKCNMIIFESDDFYDLTEERVALWRRVFDQTRACGMDIVPMFQFFKVSDALLQRYPQAVEGRSRIDRMPLFSDDWAALSKRNILFTAESPLRVSVGNNPAQFRRDYLLSEGDLAAPFLEEYAAPWMLRRMPGGVIPHGAQVSVAYSYAPPRSRALCPRAPETRALLRDALQRLVTQLRPTHVHGGFGEIARINQDLRCRAAEMSNADAFLESVALMRGILEDVQPDLKMLLWADALVATENVATQDATSLHTAVDGLPGGMIVAPRLDANACRAPGYAERTLRRLVARDQRAVLAVDAGTPELYRMAELLAAFPDNAPGLIVLNADPHAHATRVAFEKAWSAGSPKRIWPDFLNGYFDVALWMPEFADAKEAVLAHIERQMLAGVHPKKVREAYEQFVRERRGDWPRDNADAALTASLLEQATRFLELEYEYATGKTAEALRELPRVVRRYGEVDVELDAERVDRIVATIQEQRLFVPASILFGRPLACYRPHSLAAGARPYEAPVRPEYVDVTGRAEATLDFLAGRGPVFRVDFETVGARAITLYDSDDGVAFDRVETRHLAGGAITRGPLFLNRPSQKRFMRIRVESSGEQAVLRDIRAFAVKTAPRATCPMLPSSVGERMVWPEGERVAAMVIADQSRLAVAPTEIRLARNRDHLLVGIMAQDPMPHATGASMTQRDAPLWEEESVEILIRPDNRAARRFLVNPLGTRHDGMAVAGNLDQWDDGWDGDWNALAETTTTGWTATLMIPFSILGGTPAPGDIWQANFLRHRNNVERETSYWAITPGTPTPHYGLVTFE